LYPATKLDTARKKPEAASEIIDQSLPRRAPNEFFEAGWYRLKAV
jgi:hypothetical protein